MRQLIHTPETIERNMCVDLCCRNTRMAKELLDNPDISSTIKQVRCKAVTEPVGTWVAGEISCHTVALYQPPEL
jgi:hypothetical protein